MPIRNYSSKVAAKDSAALLQHKLAASGAKQVALDYDNGRVIAISYIMEIEGRFQQFRLGVNVDGMQKALEQEGRLPASWDEDRRRAQAERTAWKNKLDWMDAQLAEVAADQARMGQLLLGYWVTADGRTAWERIEDDGRLLPPATT